ncbi:MAG: LacI family DNA-binding transcriptional regulator [Roseiflexaceae bacterium]|nr:LacI family DNA-binding transcriptional regulator [Roseiflexaceae bacterium]
MARRTIVEIAERLGVSTATVSRALNNAPGVGDVRRQAILETAAQLGYHPNASARRLQGQQSQVLCYALDTTDRLSTDQFFFQDFVAVLASCCAAQGFDLLLHTFDAARDSFDAVTRLVHSGRADALILSDARSDDLRVRQLSEAGLPFAMFGRCTAVANHMWVDVDGCAGVRAATTHLIARGHTRIALLGLAGEFSCAHERERGYHEALLAAGITPLTALVARDLRTPAEVHMVVNALFDADDPPTALVASSDMLALQAMFAASQRGLQAGRDYAITGFDDLPMLAHIATPLTTVRQPLEQVCDALIAMVLRAFSGEPGPTQVLMQPELIIRESS